MSGVPNRIFRGLGMIYTWRRHQTHSIHLRPTHGKVPCHVMGRWSRETMGRQQEPGLTAKAVVTAVMPTSNRLAQGRPVRDFESVEYFDAALQHTFRLLPHRCRQTNVWLYQKRHQRETKSVTSDDNSNYFIINQDSRSPVDLGTG